MNSIWQSVCRFTTNRRSKLIYRDSADFAFFKTSLYTSSQTSHIPIVYFYEMWLRMDEQYLAQQYDIFTSNVTHYWLSNKVFSHDDVMFHRLRSEIFILFLENHHWQDDMNTSSKAHEWGILIHQIKRLWHYRGECTPFQSQELRLDSFFFLQYVT